MAHFIKKLSLLALFSFAFKVYAFTRVHDFETTRLKSTSGAGVGSVLLEEGAILNPASLSFFNISSIYAAKSSGEFTPEGTSPTLGDKKDLGFILSDSNPTLSGSAYYTKTEEGFGEKKRYGVSLSGIVSENSALGFNYRSTKENSGLSRTTLKEKKYQQAIVGFTQAASKELSYGIVLIDPFKSHSVDTKAILGIQYDLAASVALIADAGSRYDEDLSSNLLYRSALQFTILNDFFLRVGMFNDKGINEKGSSFGLSWVQPRLSIDFAIKNTKIMSSVEKNQNAYKLKETDFAISYRF